jgi:cell division control protein 6
MRIAEYLDRQARQLQERGSRIRDYRVFDFNFMPDEPLMRAEVKPVIDASLRYFSSGIANHLFIFGSRGSGKTLIVRYLARLFQAQHDATVLYVNCRQHNTSFKILAEVLGVRPRGVGLDELWQRFCALYSKPLLFILDEVDLLSDKDRHKDILYLLGRSATSPMVILLSNHPKFLGKLDESVRSSLQPELIHFRNYNAGEILKILEDRAKAGLRNFPDGVVREIAGMVARYTNSDVRVAIKTLYYSAIEPDRDIQPLFERARRDLVVDVLADLNDRNLLIVHAVAQTAEPFVKEVYKKYRQLSRQTGDEPFSYVYFYGALSYLQSIGLVTLVSTKVGRTYTNRVQLLIENGVVDDLCRTRFS